MKEAPAPVRPHLSSIRFFRLMSWMHWRSMVASVRGIREKSRLLLLVLSGLGLLAVFVLIASYVADVRTEVDPKITLLSLQKPLKANDTPAGASTQDSCPVRPLMPLFQSSGYLLGIESGIAGSCHSRSQAESVGKRC